MTQVKFSTLWIIEKSLALQVDYEKILDSVISKRCDQKYVLEFTHCPRSIKARKYPSTEVVI